MLYKNIISSYHILNLSFIKIILQDLQGLQDLCQNMNLDYKPRFIMQDHCYASLNAAKNVYPSATVLMCYFHVKLNIRKNLKR